MRREQDNEMSATQKVTITGIEISQHRLHFDPPFHASWDTKPRRHWDATIVRVTSDSGHVGVGSGDLMLGFAGHEHLFVGQDALAIERHWRVLNNISFHYGRCWPLDLALWDLAGKIANQPCWKLLGGLSDRVRAYASSGTLREPQALADAAEAYLARGFTAMKIRFHRGDWRHDVKALEAVRARIGTHMELMVDCNQGWRLPQDTYAPWSLKDAVTVARELERLGIYWMEEPLHRGDREGMRRLRDMTDLRIAGGEMTRDAHEFAALLAHDSLDVYQPDVVCTLGMEGARRLAAQIEAHGKVFTPHTWGNGIGLAANLHVVAGAAHAPFVEFPYDPPEWTPARRDFPLKDVIDIDSQGWIELGDAPGLGIELDSAMLAATRAHDNRYD